MVVGRSGRPVPSEKSPLAALPIDQINQLELSVNGATTTIKETTLLSSTLAIGERQAA